jgi:hypothetical protein
MKRYLSILFFAIIFSLQNSYSQELTNEKLNPLIGTWNLDLTPEDTTDNINAILKISQINDSKIEGYFYSEFSTIKNSTINIQSDKTYVAFVTNDNSGIYNTSFYLQDGKLYGTTHAVERNFLSVWIGIKSN